MVVALRYNLPLHFAHETAQKRVLPLGRLFRKLAVDTRERLSDDGSVGPLYGRMWVPDYLNPRWDTCASFGATWLTGYVSETVRVRVLAWRLNGAFFRGRRHVVVCEMTE